MTNTDVSPADIRFARLRIEIDRRDGLSTPTSYRTIAAMPLPDEIDVDPASFGEPSSFQIRLARARIKIDRIDNLETPKYYTWAAGWPLPEERMGPVE